MQQKAQPTRLKDRKAGGVVKHRTFASLTQCAGTVDGDPSGHLRRHFRIDRRVRPLSPSHRRGTGSVVDETAKGAALGAVVVLLAEAANTSCTPSSANCSIVKETAVAAGLGALVGLGVGLVKER